MFASAALLVALLGAGAAVAQEEEEAKKNWSNKTEFGLTSTGGNSETTNLSLGNEYTRNWEKAELLFDIRAIQNESVIKFWTGSVEDDPAALQERTDTTAETYSIGLAYRRDISKRLFWYANGGWFRNEPAGLLDRYRVGAGIGYALIETNKHTLKGQIGGSYTDDTKKTPDQPESGESETYSSATALLDYLFKFSETAELTSVASGFYDVDNSENWQANWSTSVTASLTSRLALKVTYAIVYDNNPGLFSVAPGPGAFDPADPTDPTAALPDKQFPADKTDTFLTASVVLNF
jgi:putative salt-induced outer membrane protein YdiY